MDANASWETHSGSKRLHVGLGLSAKCNRSVSPILRTKRDLKPSHYSMVIEPYSLVSNIETYVSNVFEAGGYKWRLWLYPKGDPKHDVSDHVSLYLESAEEKIGPMSTLDIYACFKFFVLNHLTYQYLTIQDVDHPMRRFHRHHTKIGIQKAIPLEILEDPRGGYLSCSDSCEFGVEIFVIKCSGKRERVSILRGPDITNRIFTWVIPGFSKLGEESLKSEVFASDEKNKWLVTIGPTSTEELGSMTVELSPVGLDGTRGSVYAQYKLRVLDQINGKHFEHTKSKCFLPPSVNERARRNFIALMPLRDLRDESNGFIVNDTLIFQSEFLAVSTAGER